MKFKSLAACFVLLVTLACVESIKAATISYSVGGIDTFTLSPSTDTLGIGAWSDSLNLTPGVPALGKINTLTFNVGDSGLLVGNFDFPLSRTMTVTLGGSQTVSQIGSLSVTLAADQLTLLGGSTISFNLPGYELDVTPLAVTTDAFGVGGGATYDVEANFLLTAVPEGGMTAGLLGIGMIGIGLFRRKI